MRGPVVVDNLNATAAVGQDVGADGPPRCPTCGSQLPALNPQPSALNSHILQVDDLTVDLISDIVRRGGKVIKLTPLPLRLLKYLMFRADEVCSRKDILAAVWGYNFKPGSMTFLEVEIGRLRAAINKGFDTRMIETANGLGYSMKAES